MKRQSEPNKEASRVLPEENSLSRADLIVYAPSGAVVMRWPLSYKEVVIGRKVSEEPAPDIKLEGPHVSRHHAKIVPTPSGHRIVDLKSLNGVKKNGVRGAAWDLSFGDEVQVGDYHLVYVVAGSDPDRTIPEEPPSTAEPRLRVDDERREVWIGGRRLDRPLSRLEFRLLSFLYARTGRVCSRDEVGAAVWGAGNFEDTMVHQLVHRLREKLGDDREHPRYLINVPGQGYRLDT